MKAIDKIKVPDLKRAIRFFKREIKEYEKAIKKAEELIKFKQGD